MYQVGSVVRHPSAGVCRIEGIEQRHFGNLPPINYYVLRPLYVTAATTVYTPVDSDKVPLRKLLQQEDMEEILRQVPRQWMEWNDNEQARHQEFSAILHGDDTVQLIRLIVLLHRKLDERMAQGKRLRASDGRYLDEAKRLLHQEVAYAMEMEPDQVADYIMEQLGKK